MLKRVAIYTRVSTVEQAEEGYSIDEQERLLIEFCDKNNYEVYKTYSDKGISGKDIKHRPSLKKLLKDAEDKKFDMVLVWKINRISRKFSDVLKMVELFENNNIAFKSYSEPFDTTTPSGKMQFQMMALIGEFERGTIAQNVKMGMCARAREGKWCGNIVLGYDLVQKSESTNKKRKDTQLIINEEEANIVREIFTLYSKGNGYKAIVTSINKKGYKTKKGNPFSIGGIKDILTNPVYIGKIRYNLKQNWSEKRRRNINPNPILVDGVHEPIINLELWDKVQTILKSKNGKPSRIYDGEYPLTGILKCPVCGAGMVIMRTTNKLKDGTKKQIAYYACGNWKNKGTAVCHSNTIRCDKANDYVFGKISELISNDKLIKSITKNINNQRINKVAPAKKSLNKIETELEKLSKRKKKVFEAYEDDLITKEEFLERKEELNKQIMKLSEEKGQALEILSDDVNEEVPYELVKSILKEFGTLLSNSVTREEKKKLIHMMVSEITMDTRRNIESINIKINDNLINYLKKEGVSIEGTPSFLLSQIGIKTLDIDIAV